MTGDATLIQNFTPCSENITVRIADGSISKVLGTGSVMIEENLTLDSVLLVPNLDCNLLSISKLTQEKNCVANKSPNHCVFQDLNSGQMIGSAELHSGLYMFKVTDSSGRQSQPTVEEKRSCSVLNEGLIRGMMVARDLGIKRLMIKGDSQLVVNQVTEVYACKAKHLQPYCDLGKQLMQQFTDIDIQHISRNENAIADAIATLALSVTPDVFSKLPTLTVDCAIPITQSTEDTFVAVVHTAPIKEWYDDIKFYLMHGEPSQGLTAAQKDAVRKRSKQYVIVGDNTLCRRSYDGILLVCLGKTEARTVLEQVHEGVCGGHIGPRAMAAQIRRLGYYWPYMENDCLQKVKTCDTCQRHSNLIHVPPTELHTTQITWPFQRWGLDIIGPITPKSSAGHSFIITATEYFTKWVEAIPLRKTTSEQVCRFILDNIVARFGIPMTIVTDNGPQFSSQETKNFCHDLGIKHSFSSPYYPQANGQAEASNKAIINLLKKMLNNSKRKWHERLVHALWAYRTTYRTATGVTPYSLVYGSEAVLPLELQVPSLRVALSDFINDEQSKELRTMDLDSVEEQRVRTLAHIERYQERQKRQHHHGLNKRKIKEGDLVLKAVREHADKFSANWEGPFLITKAYGNGAFRIADMDGNELANPVNHSYLKPYYM